MNLLSEPTFSAGSPRWLFAGGPYAVPEFPSYDVSPDRRFLMMKDAGPRGQGVGLRP